MNIIINAIVISVFVFCLSFLFLGTLIIRKFPVISKLLEYKAFLSKLILTTNSISTSDTFEDWSLKLLHKNFVINTKTEKTTLLDAYVRKYTMGQIVEIVCFKTKKLANIIHELKIYSFIFLLFTGVGFLKSLDNGVENAFITYKQLFEGNPVNSIFELFPIFEILILILLIIRLRVELLEIKEIIEKERLLKKFS